MLSWLKNRVELPGYDPSLWLSEHEEQAVAFLRDPQISRLVCCILDGTLHLSISFDSNPECYLRSYFFLRMEGRLTIKNIDTATQHGLMLRGKDMQSFLRVMGRIFAPQILESCLWPESVKKDLSGQLHKFMASLSELTFESSRKTVLYLPSGNFLPNVTTAAKNKELVQQLESIVINWTRQIKEVVNSHDNSYHTEVSGPLEEIQFWRSRTVDLSGISEQLKRDDVCRVLSVLEASKSSYLARFEALAQKIHDNSVEANDNLKFLEYLVVPCQALANSELSGKSQYLNHKKNMLPGICGILPGLLSHIRMIWMLSGM
mmetsp:Transcript_14527/g.44829  ORF Transcript_14527/g.44829 Transcript_14527/m.44829 type:complete len:318 (-) Transcript_14527:13600-14553(-)